MLAKPNVTVNCWIIALFMAPAARHESRRGRLLRAHGEVVDCKSLPTLPDLKTELHVD
jgi:hypothetical protein